jgi:DNA-binding transcriptional LysR family regulator
MRILFIEVNGGSLSTSLATWDKQRQALSTIRCPRIAGRSQPLSICGFCRAGFRTALELWLRTRREACYPTGVFRTSDIEQMRMGVLEHLEIAQAPAWLFAAELREGTVIRLLTAFERTVPILAVRPASRRLSTKVRIFIEQVEKTFALCSQFNPRPS